MENSKREIESFLYLYPSAIKYYDSIKYNQQKVSNAYDGKMVRV